MIIFENSGEIDVRAIRVLGVNSKESDHPIGFFGTGLKYAIAVLLRHNQQVSIHSGEDAFVFGKLPCRIRAADVEIVTMNGAELGFTTSLGKNWELWMAYRELYSNTVDEGGTIEASDAVLLPEAGKTRVLVQGAEFEAIHMQRARWILDDELHPVLFATKGVEIRQGECTDLFYRGINVGFCGRNKTKFTYNLLTSTELTEDRQIKNHWGAIFAIQHALDKCEDEFILEEILTAGTDFFEETFDYYYAGMSSANDKIVEVAERLYRTRSGDLNHSAAIKLGSLKVEATIQPYKPSPLDEQRLFEALAFCADIGCEIDESKLIFVEAMRSGRLGCVQGDKVYISREAFDAGTKQLVMTLVEERAHLLYGLKDATREMQEYFLRLAITVGEKLRGEPL